MTAHRAIALALVALLAALSPAAAQDGVGNPSTVPLDHPGTLPVLGTENETVPPLATDVQGPDLPPEEQVVAGLSSDSVAITASFDGSEILIYGAIKREAPIPQGPPLQVIVTVEAPSSAVTVWRKERKAGIWINAESVRIGAAPSFYAIASSTALDKALLPEWDDRYRISLPLALRAFADAPEVADAVPFTQALMRLRQEAGLYRIDEAGVSLIDQTLFRADVRLPANLVEGAYKTRIFLLREGRVIDVHVAAINVSKVGLERWLYRMAYDQPLLYGLMSLAVAVIAGWGASTAFRKLRRA